MAQNSQVPTSPTPKNMVLSVGFFNRHKKSFLFLIGLITILLAGLLALRREKANLQIVHPKMGPIVEAIYGIGTVSPRQTFRARVGVANTLSRVFVKEGDLVKKGAPLLSFISGPTLMAPFSGTVTSLPYNVGENVFPETPALTLEDLSDRYVVATLEQQGAIRVVKGQPVSLSFESIRNQTFKGHVRAIFPQKSQFIVHIECPELSAEILPGMTADVAIEVARRESALLVPVIAVSSGKILVIKNHRPEKIDIQVGSIDGEWAEVLSKNLSESDEVVIKK